MGEVKQAEHELGAPARELFSAWERHMMGRSASCSTIWAVFGVASPQGRIADKFGYNTPLFSMWMKDLAYDYGVSCETQEEYRCLYDLPNRFYKMPRSPAAAAMIDAELEQRRGRYVPMTSEARRALLLYHNETLELLGATDALVAETRRASLIKRYHKQIERHARDCTRVIASVQECPVED